MPTSQRQAYIQDQADAVNAADAILAAAQAAGRLPTEEEETQIAAHQATAVRAQRAAEMLAQQDALRVGQLAASGAGITAVHDRGEDQPWATAEDAEVRSYARVRRVSVEQATLELGFGRFMQAVQVAGSPQGRVDARLMATASGGSTGVLSDGGYLVRTDYSDMLLNRAMEEAQLAPRCMTVPIGENADSLELPAVDETSRATGSRWGGVQIYRRNEADTVTASKPKFRKLRFELEDLMGVAYATGRLIQDAPAAAAIYSRAFGSEFAFVLDDEIVRGNGNGACLGLLNSPALVTITKETNQAAATFLTENISKMWMAMPVRNRGNAVWFFNQEVEPQLDALALSAGTGALEPRFVTYGPDGLLRIKGRPVVFIEQAAALGTVGDVILADLSEYLLITKGGLQADQSMHVRFLYDENTFRWIRRVNGGPLWSSALTPYKGSQSRSPYVVLQTRS